MQDRQQYISAMHMAAHRGTGATSGMRALYTGSGLLESEGTRHERHSGAAPKRNWSGAIHEYGQTKANVPPNMLVQRTVLATVHGITTHHGLSEPSDMHNLN